jgi:hypothetical protein
MLRMTFNGCKPKVADSMGVPSLALKEYRNKVCCFCAKCNLPMWAQFWEQLGPSMYHGSPLTLPTGPFLKDLFNLGTWP